MRIFELTPWQKYVVEIETREDKNSTFLRLFTMAEALHLRPGLNERSLRRAFEKLCERHDILRSRLQETSTGWFLAITEKHALGLTVHDYEGLDPEDIDRIATKHARELIPVDGPALIRLELLKFGKHGVVIVFRAYHGVVDGFGLTLILEDLLKILVRLPFARAAMRYEAYHRAWARDLQALSETADHFWRDVLLPPPKPLNFGRPARGMPYLAEGRTWKSAKNIVYEVTPHQAKSLEDQASAEGVSSFMLVNAAFLMSLSKASNQHDFLFSVTLGRYDGRLSSFAGHHTLHPILRHRGGPTSEISTVARQTSKNFQRTLENLPAPAARRSAEWDKYLLEAGSYPRQVTTGMSVPKGKIEASLLSRLSSSNSRKPLKVGSLELRRINLPSEAGDIDELVFRPNYSQHGGTLEFKYDADAYSDEEINRLAYGVLEELRLPLSQCHLIDD